MRNATWLPVLLLIMLVIVLLPLGAAAGFEVGAAWNAGRLTRWQRLPAVPERPTRIAGGSTASVFVETGAGQIYVCNHRDDGQCWVKYDQPVVSELSSEYCAQYPNHYAVSAPPGKPVDYLRADWCHFEAGEEADYALLADGSVWMWNHWDANFLNLARVFGTMGGGACLGLVIAIAVPIFVWLKGRRARGAFAEGRALP